MKKILLTIAAMLAISASAVTIDDSIIFDGTLPEGFSYPEEKSISDLTALTDYLLDPYPICEEWLVGMDMNGDDDITIEDVTWLIDYLLDKQQD